MVGTYLLETLLDPTKREVLRKTLSNDNHELCNLHSYPLPLAYISNVNARE